MNACGVPSPSGRHRSVFRVDVQRGGDASAGFELARLPVPKALAPYLGAWLGYREWSATPTSRIELPTGRAVVIIEFEDPIAVGGVCTPGGFFAGLDDTPSLTVFQHSQAGIQLDLTTRGVLALTGGGPKAFANAVVPLEEIGIGSSLVDRLACASSWATRFEVLGAALIRRLDGAPAHSSVVQAMVQRLDAAKGALRIDALSRALGFSRQHLHTRFTEELGFSPKRYAALRRFDAVLQRLRVPAVVSLAEVALETGYADQPHFTREVRRLSGRTPSELAASLRTPMALALR